MTGAVVCTVLLALAAPGAGSQPPAATPATATAATATATAATATADGVRAVARWAMSPMSKDTNGDGIIDGDGGVPATGADSLRPSPQLVGADNDIAQPHERLIDGSLSWHLHEDGFDVVLNACRSRGATHSWTVRRGTQVVTRTPDSPLGRRTCTTVVRLPEDTYTATLRVRRGDRTATDRIQFTVRNLIVVSMGDSYGSGEGNPRNITAWLEQGGLLTGFTPYWDDPACGRSANAGPARAALALEQASTTSSVTFVHVACSGATLPVGVLGPQPGSGQSISQVERVRQIIGDRRIDAVVLSIGGNDIGFASIFASCALASGCPIAPAALPPLTGFPTLQDGVQSRLSRLPDGYRRLAGCLGGNACAITGPGESRPLNVSDAASVMPTLYPDLTRAANGSFCRYLQMTPSDFAWARSTLLLAEPPASYAYTAPNGAVSQFPLPAGTLNSQIGATAAALGWSPVRGTWAASGDSATGHGLCAGEDAWVFGLGIATAVPRGPIHPNPPGQRALGEQIAAALQFRLNP